jgi:hypothetical protein
MKIIFTVVFSIILIISSGILNLITVFDADSIEICEVLESEDEVKKEEKTEKEFYSSVEKTMSSGMFIQRIINDLVLNKYNNPVLSSFTPPPERF